MCSMPPLKRFSVGIRFLDNNNDSDNSNSNPIESCKSRFLQSPHCVSNTYTQVARAQSCQNHVQHIECLSHVTCLVQYGMTGQLSY